MPRINSAKAKQIFSQQSKGNHEFNTAKNQIVADEKNKPKNQKRRILNEKVGTAQIEIDMSQKLIVDPYHEKPKVGN